MTLLTLLVTQCIESDGGRLLLKLTLMQSGILR